MPESTPLTCETCGVPVVQAAHPTLDEWIWAGPDGSQVGGPPPGFPEDPYALLDILATTNPAAYSALLARVNLGMCPTFHFHSVRPGAEPSWTGPVVMHCDYPALLRPSGWYCRKCKEPLTGVAELLG